MITLITISFFHLFALSDSLPNHADSVYTEVQLNKILVKARKEKDHQLIADAYVRLAELHENENYDPIEAFEYYTRSLDYYNLLADTFKQNVVKERIANHYQRTDLEEEAIDLFQEVLAHHEEKGDINNQIKILLEISDVYAQLGDYVNEQSFIKQSKKLNETLRDTIFTIELLLKEADNYKRLSELDSAEVKALRAFTISSFALKDDYVSKSLHKLGLIKLYQREYEDASVYLEQSLGFGDFSKYSEEKLAIYGGLSECYQFMNDYQKAFEYLDKSEALKDSIVNYNRSLAINNISRNYETRMNKKEIKILELEKANAIDKTKQQKRANTVLTIGFALLSLAIYYIIRFYSQKIKSSRIISIQKEKINQQRFRELEDNLKMKGMQSMIEGQEIERERIAKDLHDSLGGLLSTIKLQFEQLAQSLDSRKAKKDYQKSNELLDTAVEEVRSISRNLQPSALRNLGLVHAINDLVNRVEGEHAPEVTFQHYDYPENVPTMISLSIYRIIQEMLNNALKYSQAKEVLIQLTKEDDEIVLLFEDDGVGFDIDNLKRKGMGLENIKSRVDYLKATLNVDSRVGEGTSYMVHINPELAAKQLQIQSA